MAVEVKFGGMQTVPLFLKYLFDTNVMPRIADNSYGADRRLVKLDLPWKFVEEPAENDPIQKKKDPHILDRLITLSELSGVLNLILQRTPIVIKKKMIHQKPDGLAEYGLQSRSGDVFIDIFVDATNNVTDKVHSGALRDAYQAYCSITNSACLSSKGFKTVLEEKTLRNRENSVRIGEKVSTGYSGIKFDQNLFDETLTTLEKARKKGESIFNVLITLFPSLNEDYSKNYTKLHRNYSTSKANAIVCSLCSYCSCNNVLSIEKDSIDTHRERIEGQTTLQNLQPQSGTTEDCSYFSEDKIKDSNDAGSQCSKKPKKCSSSEIEETEELHIGDEKEAEEWLAEQLSEAEEL